MPAIGQYLQAKPGDVTLRDYQHASRLYLDSAFALAPKNGWIYYVLFDIDPAAITDPVWNNQQRTTEVGMLVKTTDLPRFAVQTETMNQYNRKSVIQTKINYTPVSMSMHDDESNVVHNMWLNYLIYYSPDPTYVKKGSTGAANDPVPVAFEKGNQYNPTNALFQPANFGLNSGLVDNPFFRSITVYQLNRKVFTSYQLLNPLVQAWDHDRLDQTNDSHFAESKMTVAYDAVLYGAGRVSQDNPSGFATFHYDTTPSPLSVAGGQATTDSIEIFGDVSGLSDPSSAFSSAALLTAAGVAGSFISGGLAVGSSNGYNILAGGLSVLGNGAFNGLGTKLNTSLGIKGLTGQYPGTPISVAAVGAVAAASNLVGNILNLSNGGQGSPLTSISGGLANLLPSSLTGLVTNPSSVPAAITNFFSGGTTQSTPDTVSTTPSPEAVTASSNTDGTVNAADASGYGEG